MRVHRAGKCGCGLSGNRRGQRGAGVNSTCHGNLGGVSAHGGHVIVQPKVVAIYWDEYFVHNPGAVSTMNQFLTDLVTGTFMEGLSQYGVGPGTLQASFVIDPNDFPTPNTQNPGVAFKEADMQNQLLAWLDPGTAVVTPAPAENENNLVYLIFPPTDTIYQLGDILSSGFCGYHQHGKRSPSGSDDNLFWAIVQGYAHDPPQTTPKDFVDSISFCVSHELVEMFTNRDDNGFFQDGTGCEIGDLCEANAAQMFFTVPYGPWWVETYWSQAAHACIGPPGVATISVSTTFISFGLLSAGEDATRHLTVSNPSQSNLTVSIAPSHTSIGTGFHWAGVNTTLAPGASLDVTVTFLAPSFGGSTHINHQVGASLTVNSNAPGGSIVVTLSAAVKGGITP